MQVNKMVVPLGRDALRFRREHSGIWHGCCWSVRIILVRNLAAIPMILSRKIWRVETQPQFPSILEYDSYQHSKASKDVCYEPQLYQMSMFGVLRHHM
jgi:hypothetical protein